MANYQYIIAGLPDISMNCDAAGFDYEETRDFIKSQCSAKDCGYIDFLDSGLEGAEDAMAFYGSAARSGSSFLRDFFAFDRKVREAKVAYLEGTGLDGFEFEEMEDLKDVFSTKDLLEREKQLDRLYWQKADDLVLFDIFDIDVILCFLAKAKIVRRWNRLDPATGSEFFRQLVQEVRGTFKGVEYDPTKE